MGKVVDNLISWLIDLFLSVPHLVTLILIAFMLGGGFKGIVIGIALTHWPSLARVIRAEVMQIRSAPICTAFSKNGKISMVDWHASYSSPFSSTNLSGIYAAISTYDFA